MRLPIGASGAEKLCALGAIGRFCEAPPLERMSRHCPACHVAIPLRGVTLRAERPPESRWYRFVPARFFCANCHTELRPVRLRRGTLLMAAVSLVLALQLAALAGWLPLSFRASEAAIPICALLCTALSLAYAKWGLTYTRVNRDGATTHAL